MVGEAQFTSRGTERDVVGRRSSAEAGIDSWFPSVYECLRDIARQRFQGEAPGHTLQPTALVHDAYVRLADYQPNVWRSRTHFLAVAARALREVLVDHARRRGAVKRGGGWRRLTLDQATGLRATDTPDIVSLDEALTRLASHHARPARVVELRFFGGLTIEETAQALDVSVGTVKADWRFARSWLSHELDRATS